MHSPPKQSTSEAQSMPIVQAGLGGSLNPETTVSPVAQRRPQPPQWLRSLSMSTQRPPPQSVRPKSQPAPSQVPNEQLSPAAQRRPQVPQLSGSRSVSVQP